MQDDHEILQNEEPVNYINSEKKTRVLKYIFDKILLENKVEETESIYKKTESREERSRNYRTRSTERTGEASIMRDPKSQQRM